MKIHRTAIMFATNFALLGLVGCDKKEEPKTDKQAAAPAKAEPAKPEPAKADVPAESGDAKQALDPVLTAYEKVRADLANDKLDTVTADATALATSAKEAAQKAPENLKPHVAQVEAAAATLAGMPTTDADALRKQFGEVSKHVVAIVSAEPKLQEGLHVFECPMANGYQKWVQADDKLANPYMGTKMAECGAPSKWQS